MVIPPPVVPPVVEVPGVTTLPWVEYGNSRTLVQNCNPAGDFRKFSFTVPFNAHSAHAISGAEYSVGVGNFRTLTLKDATDGAVLAKQRSTAIMFNFTLPPTRFGYIMIEKGKTYILEVQSDPTPGYNCSYFVDLNNTFQ
jgi:hypothetical protein